MPKRTKITDRSLPFLMGLTALIFGWLSYQIFDARNQLWHHGVDRTTTGAAAGWLAAGVGAAYLILAFARARWAGTGRIAGSVLLPAGLLSAAYLLVIALSNNGKVGFSIGMYVGAALAAVIAAGAVSVRTRQS